MTFIEYKDQVKKLMLQDIEDGNMIIEKKYVENILIHPRWNEDGSFGSQWPDIVVLALYEPTRLKIAELSSQVTSF